MSDKTQALSVSFRSDDGCVEHNNRDFFSDNVDRNRTQNNIIYVRRDLREVYHELFDEALAEYNAKQNRADRQIPDYYEHIRNGKKEKLFQEIIVMFGNSDNCGVGSENWETAVKLLDEYMREFEMRNPNLKVFNAVMHLDEATPHLHIDFVPVCYGQKQGLSTRVSMKRAIQQMGFSASGKKETEAILWGNSERSALTEILNNHNIARKIVGVFHEHKTVEEYARYAKILKNAQSQIEVLSKKNAAELSEEEIGLIINKNENLNRIISKQNEELNILRNKAEAKFVPVEIFNDEKRQYIIELLQRANSPYVEENSTIYIPEYYEPSVMKALASFKPSEGQNYRERLKSFIDRLLYSARDFENFVQLLKANKYELRHGKYIAVKPPYAKRFIRLKSLGEDYSEFSLKKRIEHGNEVQNKFEQYENHAIAVEKPFYSAINSSISLVRKFEITPVKSDNQKPYDFMNDKKIWTLICCLNFLTENNITSREELYAKADELQKTAENSGDTEVKIQLSQIESVIRIYEEIVDGNYIDNLIKAERERNTETAPEQTKPPQTVNRKKSRR